MRAGCGYAPAPTAATAGNRKAGPGWGPLSSCYARSLLAQLGEQLLLLASAQTANAAVIGNLALFHERGNASLAITRESSQNSGDLGLLDDVVIGSQDVFDGDLAGLDVGLELGAGLAGCSGLLQGCSALLGGHSRQCHVELLN